jgi:PAS domain S-box-containing protein
MPSGLARRRGSGYLAGTVGVAFVTALVATGWGSWAATATSVAATLCFNFFFLPPVDTLTIADAENWVALATFLATAVTAGQLSELAKRRDTEATSTPGAIAVTAPDPGVARTLRRLVAFASLLSVTIGLLGLAGWVLGIGVLKSVMPGGVIIKPNATISLVLCGVSLWLLRSRGGERPRGIRQRMGQTLAAVVALVGVASLAEHLFAWDLGIDQLFFPDQDPWEAFGSIRPGLMAPITALDFAVIGAALLLLDWRFDDRSYRLTPAQVLAFAANTGAIVGLLDFVLESHASYTHIALQTAIALFVLSFGVVAARTDRGLGALLASASYGGVLTRRLWPAVVIVPLLIGGASWKAHSAGILSEWSGIAVMIVAMITLLAGATVWSAQSIDLSDRHRRRAEASLHRSEEELREAQRLARMGSWWWDPAADTVTWSEGLYRIAGRDPTSPPPGFREHSRFYTRESFARLMDAVERAVQTGAPFRLELDMVRADGAIRSVTSRGEAERDASGHVVLVRASVHDITEQKRAQDALRESEANLNKAQAIAHIGSWNLDLTRDRLTWSDEVFRIFGVPAGTPLTYESFLAAIHPADREAVDKAWTAALRGAPYDIEHRIVVGGAVKWVRERAEVECDTDGRALRGTGTVQDISERKGAQQELVRLNRALRALSLCNGALIRATEEPAWLDHICRIIVEETGHRFCWVGRAEDDEARTVRAVARAGVDEGYLAEVGVTWADVPRGRGPVGTAIRTGRTQIVKDTAADPSFAPWRVDASKRGYASVIAIPLVVDGGTFGALAIYAAEADAFSDQEVALLTELADDLAFGIAALRTRAAREKAAEEIQGLNAELEDRVRARTADLEAAREREASLGFRIQQMLLLTQPPNDVPGVEVAAITIPSQRIDGDFYDFFRHENGCLDVIVADVMGKGIPAALLAGATKSNVLEALCHLMGMSRNGGLPQPKEIISLAHADMVRHLIDLESFVTLSYARVDLKRHVLHLVDCGHTGMLLLRGQTGACEMLHGDNLPLGIREGEIFDQLTVPFEAGDLFVFYSDGVTDVRNGTGEPYGAQRLADCVRTNRDLEPAVLVDVIRASVMAFAASDRLADDLTCVAVRVGVVREPLAHAELDIRSDLNDLGRARAFVREFCETVPGGPLDEGEIAGLELAVNEAASNVMRHAYHGRTDQRILLDAEAFPDCVSIRLHHFGDAFDPTTAPAPALDGSRESGFGLYLISKSVDAVRYSRDERGRNSIALVKHLDPRMTPCS